MRKHGLSGFFLIYRDLLELSREVAAEVRGKHSARSKSRPAARPRPRLLRRLDPLLPDRPLARRPDQAQPVPRPLPERRDRLGAGHRPRLPARYPRAADPARVRALRPRARRARRQLPDVQAAQRDPRRRQGARHRRERARPAGEARRLGQRRRHRARDGDVSRVRRPHRCADLARPDRALGADLRLPAPPQPARRRHGDLHEADRRAGAGRAGGDGRAATSASGTRTRSTTRASSRSTSSRSACSRSSRSAAT